MANADNTQVRLSDKGATNHEVNRTDKTRIHRRRMIICDAWNREMRARLIRERMVRQ